MSSLFTYFFRAKKPVNIGQNAAGQQKTRELTSFICWFARKFVIWITGPVLENPAGRAGYSGRQKETLPWCPARRGDQARELHTGGSVRLGLLAPVEVIDSNRNTGRPSDNYTTAPQPAPSPLFRTHPDNIALTRRPPHASAPYVRRRD